VRGESGRLNRPRPLRLPRWSHAEGGGIAGVVVKCVEIGRNTEGEASHLGMR
jgi:hypothetical protein